MWLMQFTADNVEYVLAANRDHRIQNQAYRIYMTK